MRGSRDCIGVFNSAQGLIGFFRLRFVNLTLAVSAQVERKVYPQKLVFGLQLEKALSIKEPCHWQEAHEKRSC